MNERPRGRELGEGSREWPDEPDEDADDCPAIIITVFSDFVAGTKTEQSLGLAQLAHLIETITAAAKDRLPWLKLARFGELRSPPGPDGKGGNSLRHNANVIAVTGAEGDYDGGKITFNEAVEKLRAAELLVLVYTSPSYTEDGPRWRVLAPFSQEYPPDQRDRFLARLNGLLGGILSNESWTLSQSYYFGSVKQNPSHRVVVLDGTPIDLAHRLDATAIGKPEKPRANGDGRHGPATRPEDITDARIRGLVDKLLDNVRNASDGTKHHTLFDIGRTLGGYLHVIGWSEHEAVEQLCAVLPASVEDWNAARKTAAQAVALGATQPLELEDRPNLRQGRTPDQAPPPGGEPASSTHVWRSKDHHFACTPTGREERAPNGILAEVLAPDGTRNFVPKDQLHLRTNGTPNPPPGGAPPPDLEPQPPVGPPDEPPVEAGPFDDVIAALPLITEQQVMLAFARIHVEHLRFDHDRGKWFEWTGQYWRLDQHQRAFAWAMELTRKMVGGETNKTRQTAEKIGFSTAVERGARAVPPFPARQADWDPDKLVLGTPGGVVDLRTCELRPARREDLITRITAVTPAATPDCPKWLAYLEEVTRGNQALIRYLRQIGGYSLTGLTREEVLIFIWGPGGNGKGVFLNTLGGILGGYVVHTPIETFMATQNDKIPNDLAMMRGARLVLASEIEEGRAWAEVRIKQLTGRDPITARFMRQEWFAYDPEFTLIIIGNNKPTIRKVDEAIRRRLRLVPFIFKPAVPNPRLADELRPEWPGILRWLIEGCLDWQMNGLITPPVVAEATAEYLGEENVTGQWLEECCEQHPEFYDTFGNLYRSFAGWAKAHGRFVKPGKAVSEALREIGFMTLKNTPGAHAERGFAGLRVKRDARYWQDEPT